MNTNQIDLIAVVASVVLLAASLLIGGFLLLVLGVGLMTLMAAVSETGRSGLTKRAGFFIITFIVNVAVFTFLFPGSYTNAVLFALLGVTIAFLSKGHVGRALAYTFFASPILIVVLFPVSALVLEGSPMSDPFTFVGFALLISIAVVLTSLLPALVFRMTDVGRLAGVRLSYPTTGIYWSSAFWLYVLQDISEISASSTLPQLVFLWILFVIVTLEGGGFVSKIIVRRLGILPSDSTRIW